MENIEKYNEWNYSCYYNRKKWKWSNVQIYGKVKSLTEC